MMLLTLSTLLCAVLALTRAAENGTLVKRSVTCSRGWSELNGRCFRFVSKRLTWAQAEKNCIKLDGNLASVHDLTENGELPDMAYREAWIGGSDAQERKQWLWTDGTPFNYTNWCPGEPNNYHYDEHCIVMYTKEQKCWNNLTCSNKIPSVCTKRLC